MSRPLLLTGATGTLGIAAAHICDHRGLPHVATRRADMELSDVSAVREVIHRVRPWAVLNGAGYVRVDDAESDEAACFRENVEAAANLAGACSELGIPFVTFSSDLVFNGKTSAAYLESDAPGPLSAYGRSKAEAERRVLEAAPDALVIRTAAFFGPWDRANFLVSVFEAARLGEPLAVPGDLVVSPTYVPDLLHAALDLLIDGERGLWHLTNVGEVTWAEFAVLALTQAGMSSGVIQPTPVAELGLAAPRPPFAALSSERGVLLRGLDDAIARFIEDSAETTAPAAELLV